ncbi:MAG: hypothetical protein HY922_07560 [Elusimicrobia bacterium]|nr:hypothetical protein [Elusimicrobiota bacterium]
MARLALAVLLILPDPGSWAQQGIAPLGCRPPAVLSGAVCLGQFQCPAGTTAQGQTCSGRVVCPAGSTPAGNTCLGKMVCPSGTQIQGDRCVGANKCPPGTVIHFDNPKLLLCVACAKDQRLVKGQCVHCSKSPSPAGVALRGHGGLGRTTPPRRRICG